MEPTRSRGMTQYTQQRARNRAVSRDRPWGLTFKQLGGTATVNSCQRALQRAEQDQKRAPCAKNALAVEAAKTALENVKAKATYLRPAKLSTQHEDQGPLDEEDVEFAMRVLGEAAGLSIQDGDVEQANALDNLVETKTPRSRSGSQRLEVGGSQTVEAELLMEDAFAQLEKQEYYNARAKVAMPPPEVKEAPLSPNSLRWKIDKGTLLNKKGGEI